MQLQSLYIKDYKILKDFKIDFKKDVSILIGINGSGKSTILEAIAEIFSCIILESNSQFGFEIEYVFQQYNYKFPEDYKGFIGEPLLIHISSKKGEKPEIMLGIGDFNNLAKPPSFSNNIDFIPQSIIIYYSGYSEIMKSLCKPHNQLLSQVYRKGNANIYHTLFNYEPPLFDIILISLLSFEFGDIPKFLYDKAKIKGVQSIQIRLKKPTWAKGKIENWWGAKGEIRTFLEYLDSISGDLTIKDLNKNQNGNLIIEAIGPPNPQERIIINIIGQKKLFEIREHFIDERKLFEFLNTLYIDGFWVGAEFSFTKEEDGIPSSFRILSEGEQQEITIKGLTELLTNENSLFLFDEPDTYLHPSWQRNFIERIVQVANNNENIQSQFLITTHSPQLLSNANPEKSEVQIMEDGEIVKITPKYYGRDISTILYELMGVERRNKKMTIALTKLFNLIEEEDIKKAKTEYENIAKIIGEDDPIIIRAKTQLDLLEETKNETNN